MKKFILFFIFFSFILFFYSNSNIQAANIMPLVADPCGPDNCSGSDPYSTNDSFDKAIRIYPPITYNSTYTYTFATDINRSSQTYYYRIDTGSIPKSMKLSINLGNPIQQYSKMDYRTYTYYPTLKSQGSFTGNINFEEMYFYYAYNYIYVVLTNSYNYWGDFTFSLYTDDDSTIVNKLMTASFNGPNHANSNIDYQGDIDYFYITNSGGTFDIYSTELEGTNLDLKVEIYVNGKFIATNDDYLTIHPENNLYPDIVSNDPIYYIGMKNTDFGVRLKLPNNGYEYVIAINNLIPGLGSYKLNIYRS